MVTSSSNVTKAEDYEILDKIGTFLVFARDVPSLSQLPLIVVQAMAPLALFTECAARPTAWSSAAKRSTTSR